MIRIHKGDSQRSWVNGARAGMQECSAGGPYLAAIGFMAAMTEIDDAR